MRKLSLLSGLGTIFGKNNHTVKVTSIRNIVFKYILESGQIKAIRIPKGEIISLVYDREDIIVRSIKYNGNTYKGFRIVGGVKMLNTSIRFRFEKESGQEKLRLFCGDCFKETLHNLSEKEFSKICTVCGKISKYK